MYCAVVCRHAIQTVQHRVILCSNMEYNEIALVVKTVNLMMKILMAIVKTSVIVVIADMTQ